MKHLVSISEKKSTAITEFLNGVIIGCETSSSVRSEDMKNVRKRKDGRWEYRPSVNNKRLSFYAPTLKKLLEKIKHAKTNILFLNQPKQVLAVSFSVKSNVPTFIDYAWHWFNTFKAPLVGKSSADMYKLAIKYMPGLNVQINKLKPADLQKSINQIKQKRVKDYAVLLIRQVFKKALQEELIEKDWSLYIERGTKNTDDGRSLTLQEQQLVLSNLSTCKIGKLILFYLLTGCRRSEAVNIKRSDINFEKNVIEVKGTKTKTSLRYVLISEKLKNILAKDYDEIFNASSDNVGRIFKRFIKSIGLGEELTIKSLRHTFSTNLYYLGVPDKQRQGQMGHASIVTTNNIYTHLDPTITKEDILEIYGDLYPYG